MVPLILPMVIQLGRTMEADGKASKNLSQFNNAGNVQFQFVFTSDGIIENDGFSLDDFCIRVPLPDDIGVDAIISPGSNSGANTLTDMTVRVRNFGINTISVFDLYYDICATHWRLVVYTGTPLTPNATAIVTIPPQFYLCRLILVLKAYTSISWRSGQYQRYNQCLFI
jgi:hypothetical protein